MALAVSWVTTATFTTSAALYTTPASSASAYAYARDLVVTNSGTAPCFVAVGPSVTSAATTSSFAVPTGATVILTEGQVPPSSKIYGCQSVATTTSQLSIGWASNVSYV